MEVTIGDVVSLASELLGCETEAAIFNRLASFATRVGHESSRVYLVNLCPFKHKLIYTLAFINPSVLKAKSGDKIEASSIRDDEPYAVVQSSIAALDKEKAVWINDLELINKEWIDLSLKSGRSHVGLWSLSRPETDKFYSRPEIESLSFLATVASAQIEKFRSLETLKARSVFADEVDRPGGAKRNFDPSETQSLNALLEKVRKILSAQFVAYFQWTPSEGALQKKAEASAFDSTAKFETELNYAPGARLTGSAYKSAELRFVPFFENLCEFRTELADPLSIQRHEEIAGCSLKSIMYVPVEPFGTCPGLLRVINRAESPQLPFQQHDIELLQLLGQFLEKALSIEEASAILENLRVALGVALNFERSQNELFEEIQRQTKRLGFDGLSIVQANAMGLIVTKRCWPDSLSRRLEQFDRGHDKLSLPASQNENIESVDDTPSGALRVFLNRIGEQPIALSMQFSHPEGRALIFLPNVLEAPRSQKADEYWRKHRALKNSLHLFLELCKYGILMRANRDAVRNAEIAVAVIAHEFRSPSIALRSQANAIAEHIETLLNKNSFEINVPIRARVSETGPPPMISNTEDLRRYLANVRSVVKSADSRLARAVKDGLLWARTSSNVIELIFERCSIKDLVDAAIAELWSDVAKRPRLDVRNDIDSHMQAVVVVPDMVQAMLVNLLDNAIKYSFASETVSIRAKVEAGFLELVVRNLGLGIHERDLPHIFAPFYRATVRDELHPVRGVGLGLSTCKRIAQLHGGDISAISVPTYDSYRTEKMEGFETTFVVRIRADLAQGRRDVNVPLLEYHVRQGRG